MWWPAQERNSLWEYALAHKALTTVFKRQKGLRVADYGYRTGYLTPMLVWLGHDTTMVEIERKPPDEENYMLEHLLRVTTTRNENAGPVAIWPKPLGQQVGRERQFDAVFSLSTLRKLGLPKYAFLDCLTMVKPGGMLFMTMSEEDSLPQARKFTKEMHEELIEMALRHGFKLLDGVAEYDWNNQENSFTSMALLKEKE